MNFSYLLAAYRLDSLEHEVLVDVVDIGLALAKDEHWLGVGRGVGRGVGQGLEWGTGRVSG